MSRPNETPLSPEDLNRLWDMAVDSGPAEGEFKATPEATIITWLQSAAPVMAETRSASLWSRVAPALNPPVGNVTPSAPARTRSESVRPILQFFGGPFTTGALVVVAIAIMLIIGPMRSLWQTNQPAGHGTQTEEPSSDFTPGSERQLISIVARPENVATVGFWEVTMPPGSVLRVPAAIQELGPQGINAWVEEGSLIAGAGGFEHEVGAGQTTAMEPAPTYFRNPTAVPTRVLLLVSMTHPHAFPLQFTDWAEESSMATPESDYAASNTRPIDFVPLDPSDAAQFRVTIFAATYAPGTAIPPVDPSSRTREGVHSVTILNGEMVVAPPPAEGTPSVTEVLSPGMTVTITDSEPTVSFVATGDDNLTLLTLTITPWSNNPTLDQTVDPVAPFWGEWTVPDSGEVHLTIRSIGIDPGGQYEMNVNAGLLYFLAEGNLTASNAATGVTNALDPGSILAQDHTTVLTFTNDTQSPAQLVQVIVSDEPIATPASLDDGIKITSLVETEGLLPAGDADLMLVAHRYNGVNDGGSSGSGSPGLVLLTALDGGIQIRRDGGDAVVIPAPGEQPIESPLGEEIVIEPAGYMLVLPYGGWAVTGAAGQESTALVLSVSPTIDDTAEQPATPAATPAALSSGTITLRGNPTACDVTPVTIDRIAQLMATPVAVESPLDRSSRKLPGDRPNLDITAAIIATMQGYADCTATGEYARSAAFLSDQAIRESEVMRDLTEQSHDTGDRPGLIVTIEDIVILPDGRAGARAVVDGEAVYLTFVMEHGHWVIDVWDDSQGGPPINATPVG